MRYLGVDLGDVRTGLALSDPMGVTCRPLEVLEERERVRLSDKITEVARENDAQTIVVGLPRPLSGGTNRQVESVLAFVSMLSERSSFHVETWDERFTSRLAEADRPRGKAQDAVAACYMLQNYLDARAMRRGEE
jgi:putative holliday junction resolvase